MKTFFGRPLTLALAFVLLLGAFQNCAGQHAHFSQPSLSSDENGTTPDVGTVTPLPDSGNSNDSVHGTMVLAVPSSQFAVMNKHQILSRLEFIFGPTIGTTFGIATTLQQHPSEFGGQCNLFEYVATLDSNGRIGSSDDPLTQCTSTAQAVTPIVPPLNGIREATMDKICSRAVNSSATLLYALEQINPAISSVTTNLPSVDEAVDSLGNPLQEHSAGLYQAFRLFYPTQPDPHVSAPNLLESFRAFFADPDHPQISEWQTAMYAVCLSPYWRMQ